METFEKPGGGSSFESFSLLSSLYNLQTVVNDYQR